MLYGLRRSLSICAFFSLVSMHSVDAWCWFSSACMCSLTVFFFFFFFFFFITQLRRRFIEIIMPEDEKEHTISTEALMKELKTSGGGKDQAKHDYFITKQVFRT